MGFSSYYRYGFFYWPRGDTIFHLVYFHGKKKSDKNNIHCFSPSAGSYSLFTQWIPTAAENNPVCHLYCNLDVWVVEFPPDKKQTHHSYCSFLFFCSLIFLLRSSFGYHSI